MRHMTHEKMKSHTVQGKVEMKGPVQLSRRNPRADRTFPNGPRGILEAAACAQGCLLWFLWFCSGYQRCHHRDCTQDVQTDEL